MSVKQSGKGSGRLKADIGLSMGTPLLRTTFNSRVLRSDVTMSQNWR